MFTSSLTNFPLRSRQPSRWRYCTSLFPISRVFPPCSVYALLSTARSTPTKRRKDTGVPSSTGAITAAQAPTPSVAAAFAIRQTKRGKEEHHFRKQPTHSEAVNDDSLTSLARAAWHRAYKPMVGDFHTIKSKYWKTIADHVPDILHELGRDACRAIWAARCLILFFVVAFCLVNYVLMVETYYNTRKRANSWKPRGKISQW